MRLQYVEIPFVNASRQLAAIWQSFTAQTRDELRENTRSAGLLNNFVDR